MISTSATTTTISTFRPSSAEVADRVTVPLPLGLVAHVAFTNRADGDFRIDTDPAVLDARQRAVVDLPWSWLHQTHSATVATVTSAGQWRGDSEGDALVTSLERAPLAVRGADCPVVVFVGERGMIGAAHAGWRGLAGGVLDAAVTAMRNAGSGPISAYLGPCIGPECYEFSASALAELEPALGASAVGARTSRGTPALDLVAGVRHRLGALDVAVDRSSCRCTSCSEDLYSHRARVDTGRHAAVIWLDRASGPAA